MNEESTFTFQKEGRPAGSPFDIGGGPELLAPAGSMEAFRGALAAGADAFYLAGEQYGARAYAANFTREEILVALRKAHLFGKRIYLTVNTLTRQSELPGLVEFVTGLAEEGNLDGVIVQDLGVLCALRKACPGLSLHASTQMSVTGAEAARFLKEQGVCRVVPARELSLEEIRTLREETGMELETFIHGAMCYCYSGKCLFSSLIGGRSGNRGRCAQPCRLPYSIQDAQGKAVRIGTKGKGKAQEETYPLSMKDLCTLDILPELIEAGISSFKIEGRMKKPEYAAGVTAIYRKYIDRYMAAKKKGKEQTWQVDPGDRVLLQKLYLRTELNTGYYHQKNGPGMVTMGKPGYLGAEESLLKEIREKYLTGGPKIPVKGETVLKPGEPARLRLEIDSSSHKAAAEYDAEEKKKSALFAEVIGDAVQPAKSRPMEEEEVRKRLLKTGDTPFVFADLKVRMQGEIFLPVASLNALRREGLQALEDVLLRHNEQAMRREKQEADRRNATVLLENVAVLQETAENTGNKAAEDDIQNAAVSECFNEEYAEIGVFPTEKETVQETDVRQLLWAQVVNADQWKVACAHPDVAGVIDDSGLFLGTSDDSFPETEDRNSGIKASETDKTTAGGKKPLILLGLPYVYRSFHHKWMEKAWQALESGHYNGALVRTLEELQFLREHHYRGIMIADSGLYQWNRESRELLLDFCTDGLYPLELNRRELQQVFGADSAKAAGRDVQRQGILTVYGRLPMMVTANCIRKTAGQCDGRETGFLSLTDRMGEKLPVRCFCGFCTNLIYNSVPLSLHSFRKDPFLRGCRVLLCGFTTEKELEMQDVLDWYGGMIRGQEMTGETFPVERYTTGHYRKGAE